MNFKGNCLKIITLVCSVFMISSCFFNKKFEAYEPFISTEEFVEETGNGYFKPASYSSYKAYDEDGNMKPDGYGSTYDITYNYFGKRVLRSTKEQKIVVIPVEFEDFTAYTLNVSKEEYVLNLQKAFFGKASTTRYVSVADYYNRSSYGKLSITGHVCDKFYKFDTSVADININKSSDQLVRDNHSKVIDWYRTNYPNSGYDLKNGTDTAIYLVYTLPSDSNTENPSFFWAYTFPDLRLSWSSYSMMNTITGDPDAHTFIHEVGHLFGLMDYYPKESDNKTIEPTARIDMMDCSIGDHSAFSKMYLNWVMPYHVNNSCEFTLKPLVKSGDVVLINDNWNGTVFDEYYLIEFFSPVDLNYFDTMNGNNKAKLPTLPGIKIYHVDARLGYFDKKKSISSSSIFMYYCDEYPTSTDPDDPIKHYSPGPGNMNFAHDNTTNIIEGDDKDIHINYLYELKLNHVDSGSATGCATNINLYRSGDTFSADKLIFNKENSTKYNISVTGLTYEEATIKIEKL